MTGPQSRGVRGRRRWRLATIAGVAAAAALTFIGSGTANAAPSGPHGVDVSHHQGSIDWAATAHGGVKFAYIKATEGTTYHDAAFAANYNGAYRAGVVRGAYHFAHPSSSSGAAQANYFLAHGGGWSADGRTLPGALDIEYNPSGATRYGMSAGSMVNWIADFRNTYHARTGRWPVIYTTTDWWTRCTGNYAGFAATSPLWLARYASSPGALPAGWKFTTIWQYADQGSAPGDQDVFNGSATQLTTFARGGAAKATGKPTPKPTTAAPSTPSSPTAGPSHAPSATTSPSQVATHSPTAAPSASPSDSAPALPVTGTSLGLLAGGGAALIAGGVILYLLTRRRRTSS